MDVLEFNKGEKVIMSLDFILLFIRRNFPSIQVKSVTPYSFTVGSNNNGENLPNDYELPKSLMFGKLFVCINPNNSALANEQIVIKYQSYFNTKPYTKVITRQVEKENIINENSNSDELFDRLEIDQASAKYDFYLTFVGYKIDYN